MDKNETKESGDPAFLLAKGRGKSKDLDERGRLEKEHRSKLANAIYMAVVHHGYATVRAIGTYAIANAVRSITMASERCRKKDINLWWESSFDKGNVGPMRDESHVNNVAALFFRIQHWEDKGTSNNE